MGFVGKEMLLFSTARVRFLALFFAFILLTTAVSSKAGNSKESGDLVTKTKKTDLLTNDRTLQKDLVTEAQKKVNTPLNKGKIESKVYEAINYELNPLDSKDIEFYLIKPEKDYIDVYVGRCPFTVDAIKEIQRFKTEHKDFHIRFFMTRTSSNYELNPSDLKDIVFHLPINAQRYNITSVPSFVLNVNGKVYKVSGAIDLEEIYKEIVKGQAKGEKKDGYIELGSRGKECKAIAVNLKPRQLSESDVKKIEEEKTQLNLTALLRHNRTVLPEVNDPVVINKKVAYGNLTGISRFIVFSESQKDWAKEMIEKGAVGCCTNCTDLKDMENNIQFCTRELLDELGVKSVPSVVNIN
jgi:hypothetical protein